MAAPTDASAVEKATGETSGLSRDTRSGRTGADMSSYVRKLAPLACADCGIRHLAICAALGDREIRELDAIMSHRWLASHQSLAIEGDEVRYAYNVISGGLKIYKSLPDGRTQIVGFLLPGDFLGLPRKPTYGFSADALGPTELCQLPKATLISLFDRYEGLQERVLAAVHDDLAIAQEHMLLLGCKTANERVGTFLLRLLQRNERQGRATEPLHIPLSRGETAEYLGLTLETVSRSFAWLRKQSVIRLLRPDQVVIEDRRRLEELSDPG